MDTLIELRTDGEQKLIGRLEPGTLRLHVRMRQEECVFDLPAIVRASGRDVLIRVCDWDVDPEIEGKCPDS